MVSVFTRTGIGLVTRKVGNSITSYEEWKREGEQWTLHITSTFKSKLLTFKLDQEFDEETMDGRKVKVSRCPSPPAIYCNGSCVWFCKLF